MREIKRVREKERDKKRQRPENEENIKMDRSKTEQREIFFFSKIHSVIIVRNRARQ